MKKVIDKSKIIKYIIEKIDLLNSNEVGVFQSISKDIVIEAYKDILNFLDTLKSKDTYVYVVTRYEEHSDYVEEVFYDEKKAQEYCDKFNSNEDNYSRQITKIKINI